MPPVPPVLLDVRLMALPLTLHERAQAHTDGLLREFRLLLERRERRADGGVDVPSRLLRLVHQLQEQYSTVSEEQEQIVEDALARGETVLGELVYHVPSGVGAACTALGAMLDEADAYCTSGRHLLMLATPPDLVRYRSWYLQEFVDQTAGAAPVPWSASPWARGTG